jgi:hypothetical protein
MRKIGIATLTLAAMATAACGESPVAASAAGAEASLNEVWVEAGAYVEADPVLSGPGYGVGEPEVRTPTTMTASGIGFLGSGH